MLHILRRLPDDLIHLIAQIVHATRIQRVVRCWLACGHTRRPEWRALRARLASRDMLARLEPYARVRREWRSTEAACWLVSSQDDLEAISQECVAGMWG